MSDVSVERLTEFDADTLCEEIEQLCPVLSAALKGAAGITGSRYEFVLLFIAKKINNLIVNLSSFD